MTRHPNTARTAGLAALGLAVAATAGSNACYPDVLAHIETPAFARGVRLIDVEGRAFLIVLSDTTMPRNGVEQEQAGVLLYDATDPFNPVLVGEAPTAGTASDVAVWGDEFEQFVCIADRGGGGIGPVGEGQGVLLVYTVDVGGISPGHGYAVSPGDALGVDAITVQPSGRALIALADGHAGVQLYEVDDTGPSTPQLQSTIDTAGLATGVLFDPSGPYLYVADGFNGLLSIDISDPELPIITGQAGLQSAAIGLSLAEDERIAIAHHEGVALATRGPTPVITDDYQTPGSARAVGSSEYDGSSESFAFYAADLFAGAHRITYNFDDTIGGISHTIPTTQLSGGPAVDVVERDGIAYIATNQGGVLIANATDCSLCPADFAPAYGTLDLADVVEFTQNFQGTSNYNEPGRAAALAEPTDVTDLADIVAFVESFSDGCP